MTQFIPYRLHKPYNDCVTVQQPPAAAVSGRRACPEGLTPLPCSQLKEVPNYPVPAAEDDLTACGMLVGQKMETR